MNTVRIAVRPAKSGKKETNHLVIMFGSDIVQGANLKHKQRMSVVRENDRLCVACDDEGEFRLAHNSASGKSLQINLPIDWIADLRTRASERVEFTVDGDTIIIPIPDDFFARESGFQLLEVVKSGFGNLRA